jgi:ParB family chromosome partitioning protein
MRLRIILGEFHENAMRKDFTVSERVAIGKALEQYLGSRQGQRTDKELVGNCPQVEPGRKTRELAAEKAGFESDRTYRRAKKVVDRAQPEIVDAVDAGALRVSQAAKVVDADPEVQRQVADLAQQGKRNVALCLLRQAVAEGVIAEEGHNPDGAVEALQDVQGLLEGQAEGLGQPLGRLWPLA